MAIQVASPSSSFSFTGKSKYRFDAFLSFRGEDTRHSFTVPLYNALRRKGINAFIDDRKLGKGEEIAPSLIKAIERSRISIIVFSKNYATSTWCLDELAHIIRCKNENNQLVMPIFYKVDPLDVQFLRDRFETAMTAHKDRFGDDPEKVPKWRFALSEAASLSKAWLFNDGYEFGFIDRIVNDAYAMLPSKRLHSLGYMVGLEPRVEKVISLLNQSDDRVCMLGIHGTGGIGKTTLAKAVYKSIFYHFEGFCFLFDVKEASKRYRGIVRLQQKLLSKILEEKIMMFGSVDEGISRIKHRLSHKKVLLVLDDVDEVVQLENLAGGCDWFGRGSKVIITTRNKQLLIACNVERRYEVMKLTKHDSLELFCWHAFHMNQPPENYQDLSSCAISYAEGIPLALRVIGSNLADKNLEEWRSILEQYKRIPERTIHEILKISYNCLQDGAKRIFLDIACFDDKKLGSIKEIVEACDFGARFYLEVLVDKSLINLADNGWFSMHDLIQQMGREIVRQEAPLNPEKRTRLWHYEDVLKVLQENLGCNNIEGIKLDPPKKGQVKWSGIAFKNMNNLRILIVRNVQFSTGPRYLPNSLRWLEWEGYPSTTLPADFSLSGLIFLKLPGSSFRLKEPFKSFTSYMREMDFSYCKFITEIPDISQMQSLRALKFAHCRNLIKVHDSVGSLSKLVRLYFYGCTKLSSFPREIQMPSLKVLHLGRCRSLDYFPHVVGKMDAPELISIEGTGIKELPPSIGNLSKLQCLFMDSCKSLGEELLLGLNYLRDLEELDLSRNDFVSLPKCIKECVQLWRLDVSDCKSLRDIPELPSNLHQIKAENCTSLTAESLDTVYSQAKRELLDLDIRTPATTFPDWFDYCCEGDTLCFRARGNLPHAVLAFEAVGKASTRLLPFQVVISINGRVIEDKYPDFGVLQRDHVLLYDQFLCFTEEEQKDISRYMELDWNDVEIQITSHLPDVSIVKCGVYVYKMETNMENVRFKTCNASASLKRKAIDSSPDSEPPNKFMRTSFKAVEKGKLDHAKKGSRKN